MTTFGSKLVKWFGSVPIPYIGLGVLAIHLFTVIAKVDIDYIALIPEKVYEGEVWRLFTWYFTPLEGSFTAWTLIIYLIMFSFVRAIEYQLGPRLNTAFYLLSWIIPTLLSLILNERVNFNISLGTFILLIYFGLNMNGSIYLMFILPVKIKFICYMTWIFFFIHLFQSLSLQDWPFYNNLGLLLVYVLLFGWPFQDINPFSKKVSPSKKVATPKTAFHECSVCGETEVSNEELEFRMASDGQEYCLEHLPQEKR